jgi:hypothetical protein
VSLALTCLVGLTVLIGGITAAVPVVLREREPKQRNLVALPAEAERLRLVQAPGDRWYLNGEPIARSALAERLQRTATARELRFLPSAALPMGTVTDSLAWLRQLGDHTVMLELLPPRALRS